MTAAISLIQQLALAPHPEGGYYRETYRSDEQLPRAALPGRYGGDRSVSTAIYYLLEKDDFSALHRVKSDEIFHFYLGSPVEILIISPEGNASTTLLCGDIARGHRPQCLVPKGSIQGLRVAPGGEFALLGATVAPGFDFADFELIPRTELLGKYPEWSSLILALTRA